MAWPRMLSQGGSTEVQGGWRASGDASAHRGSACASRWRAFHRPGCRPPPERPSASSRSRGALDQPWHAAPKRWRRSLNRPTGRSTLSSSPAQLLSSSARWQALVAITHSPPAGVIDAGPHGGSLAAGLNCPAFAAIAFQRCGSPMAADVARQAVGVSASPDGVFPYTSEDAHGPGGGPTPWLCG